MSISSDLIRYQLVSHYEHCFAQYGDTHRGVDWPNQADALRRYEVMLGLIRPIAKDRSVSLLDLGCGAGHLYDFLRENNFTQIEYSGLDLSPRFIALCREKFPHLRFYLDDLLDSQDGVPDFDYVVMNGVLTEKREFCFDQMWTYTRTLLCSSWNKTRIGLAFNFMSKQVDWEREDLFHVPLDLIADFLAATLSRHFVIRQDYGLYEYTIYVYRNQYEKE